MASRGNRGGARRPRGKERSRHQLVELLAKVERHVSADQLEAALGALDDAPEPVHALAGYQQVKGDLLRLTGQMEEALAVLEDAHDRFQLDEGVALSLALLHSEQRRFALAIKVLQDVSRARRGDVSERLIEMLDDLQGYVEDGSRATGTTESSFLQAAIKNDRAQLCLEANEYKAAVAACDRAIEAAPGWAGPRNNRALGLLFLGKVQEAIAQCEHILTEIDPGNLHAAANMVQCLSSVGRNDELSPFLELLRGRDLSGQLDLSKLIHGLAFARDTDELWRIGQAVLAEVELAADLDASLLYVLAAAAANVGQSMAAARVLEMASDRQPDAPGIADLIDALAQSDPGEAPMGPALDGRFPYTHLAEMIPLGVLDELASLTQDRAAGIASPRQERERLKALSGRYPQLVGVAERMIWDEGVPEAGIGMLEMIGSPSALAALRRFAASKRGTLQDRATAVRVLYDAGEIDARGFELWHPDREQWVTLELRGIKLVEPVSSLEPPVRKRMQWALQMSVEGSEEEGERELEELWRKWPDQPELAVARGQFLLNIGHLEEATEWLERALALDPNHNAARPMLASVFIRQSDLEKARAQLELIEEADEVTFPEFGGYLIASAELAIERGEFDQARGVIDELEDRFDVPDVVERLEELLREREMRPFQLGAYHRYHDRKRAQPISPDATLEHCLDRISLQSLRETAWFWDLTASGRKAEVIERVAVAMRKPNRQARAVKSMDAEVKDALRFLLERGGAAPWRELVVRYGDDYDESPYWYHSAPSSVPGWLRMCGLLAVGTFEGEVIALIPQELRLSLQQSLGS